MTPQFVYSRYVNKNHKVVKDYNETNGYNLIVDSKQIDVSFTFQ